MVTIIRTLIGDEQPLARERLKSLLQTETDIQIVGECPDGRSLIEFLQREAVGLLLLEIELPELNAFDTLKLISAEQLPAVIFVTAHDRYALEAFEFHPVDYLVKPVEKARLLTAINRARLYHSLGTFNIDLNRRINEMLAELETRRSVSNRIAVRADGEITFLYPEEIDWVESAGRHLCLHIGGEKLVVNQTLCGFEKKVSTYGFAWITRSKLVNTARIRTVRPASFGEYSVEMRDGTKLVLGRGYRKAFFESIDRGQLSSVDTS
jgi:two-component system, LytTR family, response regulator